LVKFDVTASDGSGNGWNYEDGTFSPDEIRERIVANNAYRGFAELKPLTHRLFLEGGALAGDARGECPDVLPADPLEAEHALEEHPWCGAQSTIQRWWADPLLNQNGKDRTIRTVFTHDHFGPSSHQQHGFYAALVIEPNGSSWTSLAGKSFGGSDADGNPVVNSTRKDGGPTSFAANILDPAKGPEPAKERREYNLAVADFALLYTAPPLNQPISPPGRLDHDLPEMTLSSGKPAPEGISVSDPGGQLINYRNEPIPLRIGTMDATGNWSLKTYRPTSAAACVAAIEASSVPMPLIDDCGDAGSPDPTVQACRARTTQLLCDQSDLANVFSSFAHVGDDAALAAAVAADGLAYDTRRIFLETYLRRDCADTDDLNCNEPATLRKDGDPSTWLLAAREGDDLSIRLIQGAQEENHIFFMNGSKWLAVPESANSGYRAAQAIGISEHFEFNVAQENAAPQLTMDQLYGTTASDNFWDGQWGLLRTVGSAVELPSLKTLETNAATDVLIRPNLSTCDPTVPTRSFKVEAWRIGNLIAGGRLHYHDKRDLADPNARIFVVAEERVREAGAVSDDLLVGRPDADVTLIASGAKAPEPLILRARAGECVEVELTNMLEARTEDVTDPATWSWVMMPPIADGLNFNDVPASNAVGLHAQLMAQNAMLDDASAVGGNVSSLAYPCQSNTADDGVEICQTVAGDDQPPEDKYAFDNRATYRWYAGDWTKKPDASAATFRPIEFGAIGLQDFGDVIKGGSHGLIGALMVEPVGASWKTDCEILRVAPGADPAALPRCLNAAATVTTPDGKSFREFVLIYQNDASLRYRGEPLANLRNGDDAEDSGQKAFNYRFEPFWTRLDANPAADPESMMDYDYSNVLSSQYGQGDPATPLFATAAGTPVRLRIVEPSGHPRNGAFALSGHDWVQYPWALGSTVQSADPGPMNRDGVVNAIGPGRHVNVLLDQAGGVEAVPGDYLYRSPLGFAFGGGQWGIMRVYDPALCVDGLVQDPNTGLTQVCG
jgi:manganese oxidase